MSASITADNTTNGLVAQSILGGVIPDLPQPVPSLPSRKRKYTTSSSRRTSKCHRTATREPSQGNPWCVSCHVQMTRNGKAPYGVTKWWCNQCEYNIKAYYQRAYRVLSPRSVKQFPDRPTCLTCRKPYYRKGERIWYCGHCDYSVKRHVSAGKGVSQRRYPIANRPHCVKCRHHLSYKAKGPKNPAGWACRRCRFVLPSHYLPRPAAELHNPCCLKCRQPMRSKSARDWKCYDCNVVHVKVSRRVRKPLDMLRPWCVACRRPLACSGANKWHCNRCGYLLQTHRVKWYPAGRRAKGRKGDGTNLLSFCLAAVPSRYVDREDVVQELALRLLAGELCECEVTPLKVKQIDRELLKRRCEYQNVSLETPNREGVRLEERLAG